MIIKAFYKNFVDQKVIPEYSENVNEILKYFNKFEDYTPTDDLPLIEIKNENPEKKAIKILRDIFIGLKKYVHKNEDENIINILDNNIRILEKFINNGRKIYIPFIGVSNAGKSTILNCIVGYKLFPESMNECTTRGIIIQYDKEIQLFETEIDSEINYYIFSEKKNQLQKVLNKFINI